YAALRARGGGPWKGMPGWTGKGWSVCLHGRLAAGMPPSGLAVVVLDRCFRWTDALRARGCGLGSVFQDGPMPSGLSLVALEGGPEWTDALRALPCGLERVHPDGTREPERPQLTSGLRFRPATRPWAVTIYAPSIGLPDELVLMGYREPGGRHTSRKPPMKADDQPHRVHPGMPFQGHHREPGGRHTSRKPPMKADDQRHRS